ncbi:hypothetical protein Glove_114g113 [Diversispora epigaea]|uniref:Uncharacterized protein n=1 Tax=Diversispora epigaea TaxID=1348612 RepID=A0A397JA83_9GLOM|nr:hypothetical protein Glove_114g113 [Diversispora epigaea]
MQEIGVTSFKFIPSEKKPKYSKWSWCTLMGPAKLKIIEKFPLSTFINGQRGKDIEKLWRDFYNLYYIMKSENLTIEDITQFSYDVRKWVQEFARPLKKTVNGQIEQEGLYQRTDVTPYMHVFAFHMPLFMQELHQQNLNLRWFTTSSVEKKNHEHVNIISFSTHVPLISLSSTSTNDSLPNKFHFLPHTLHLNIIPICLYPLSPLKTQ